MGLRKWAALGVAGLAVYAGGRDVAAAPAVHASPAAAQAIAYARAQIGKPYLWGATGPDAFDCSGLVQQAYAHAGISIARTTFDQWRTEPHVTTPEPGDLAFFAGADGTMTDPGHVGIVIGGGNMIQALGKGTLVMVSSYDRPDLVGFTDPAAGGSA